MSLPRYLGEFANSPKIRGLGASARRAAVQRERASIRDLARSQFNDGNFPNLYEAETFYASKAMDRLRQRATASVDRGFADPPGSVENLIQGEEIVILGLAPLSPSQAERESHSLLSDIVLNGVTGGAQRAIQPLRQRGLRNETFWDGFSEGVEPLVDEIGSNPIRPEIAFDVAAPGAQVASLAGVATSAIDEGRELYRLVRGLLGFLYNNSDVAYETAREIVSLIEEQLAELWASDYEMGRLFAEVLIGEARQDLAEVMNPENNVYERQFYQGRLFAPVAIAIASVLLTGYPGLSIVGRAGSGLRRLADRIATPAFRRRIEEILRRAREQTRRSRTDVESRVEQDPIGQSPNGSLRLQPLDTDGTFRAVSPDNSQRIMGGGRRSTGRTGGFGRLSAASRNALGRLALERGIAPQRLQASLSSASDVVLNYINRFHEVPGFDRLFLSWFTTRNENFRRGYRFVMHYLLDNLNQNRIRELMRQGRIEIEEPRRGSFVHGRRRSGRIVRQTDLTVDGIRYEFKSVLELSTRSDIRRQLRLDLSDVLAQRPNLSGLRWVFDATRSRMTRGEVVETMQEIISREIGTNHPRFQELIQATNQIVVFH